MSFLLMIFVLIGGNVLDRVLDSFPAIFRTISHDFFYLALGFILDRKSFRLNSLTVLRAMSLRFCIHLGFHW